MEKGYPYLGRLASGEEVWGQEDIPRPNLKSGEDHKEEETLFQALAQIESDGRQEIVYEAKFEKVVGWDCLIQTQPNQRGIVWVQIPGLAGHIRVSVLGLGRVRREPTKSLTVELERRTGGGYTLRAFWYGPWRPAEPWEQGAGPEALAFWMTHAVLARTINSEWLKAMKMEMPPEWMEAMNRFGDCAIVKAAINAEPSQDPDIERLRKADSAVYEKLLDAGRALLDANPNAFNRTH
jgi:hypothetical protein